MRGTLRRRTLPWLLEYVFGRTAALVRGGLDDFDKSVLGDALTSPAATTVSILLDMGA